MDSYCSNCGKTIQVPSYLIGQDGVCPFCKGNFLIEAVVDLGACESNINPTAYEDDDIVILEVSNDNDIEDDDIVDGSQYKLLP